MARTWPRPEYSADYYGSFLLDPDGNSAEAVHRAGMRREGVIDHLWIRVADLERAKRFYETVASYPGFVLRGVLPAGAHFGTPTATTSRSSTTAASGDTFQNEVRPDNPLS